MTDIVRGAIEGARDQMLSLAREVGGDRGMTQEAMLRRYVGQHRGNSGAMIDFARRMAPGSANPIEEAVRYEQQMERLLKERGG